MISYKFDLHPRDDPRDGARILRFTQLVEAEWNAEANGTGSGFLVLPADSTDADSIDPRGLQYVRVIEVDDAVADGATLSGFDERVVFGFFLDTGDFSVLDERNSKRLTFGGAGTLSYWGRAVMAPHTYLGAAGELSGISGGQDPFDGAWRLFAQGPLIGGDHLGAVLYRVLGEAKSWQAGAYSHKHGDGIIYVDTHADDRLETAVPEAVINFDGFLDSDGNAWTEPAGGFRVAILDNVLSVMRLLMEAGLYVEMDPDTFETNAYPAATHRRDRTGTSWGAGVVRFQAPTDGTLATGNILSDVKRALTPHIQRSALWAGGAGDIYAVAAGTTDIPWEGGYQSDAENVSALSAVATRQISALADAGDTLRIRWVPGQSPATGYFRPLHTDGVLLDDLATVHNGAGTWDFDEQTFPVAGVGAKLRSGGDWDVFYDLGASYRSMESRQFQVQSLGTHTHQPNPQLCISSSVIPLILHFSDTFDSACSLGASNPASGEWVWDVSGACVSSGGSNDNQSADLATVAPGDYVRFQGLWKTNVSTSKRELHAEWTATPNPPSGNQVGSQMLLIESTGNASVYSAFDVTVGPAPAGVVGVRVSGESQAALSELTVSVSASSGAIGSGGGDGHPDLVGSASRATRCDHRHDVHRDTAPTVADDDTVGYKLGTIWAQLDDLTTPTVIVGTWMLVDVAAGAAVWLPFGGTDDQTAAEVSFTPAGTIAASDTQAAVEEVATDAAAALAAHELGDLADVDLTTTPPIATDVLSYDGADWVPTAPGAPGAHAASHEDGGADELEIADLATAESDTALVLHPDGSGGVAWGTDATGGGGGGGRANMFIGSLDALRHGTFSLTANLVANRAYVCKMVPDQDITITKARLRIAGSVGNLDIAIYDEALTTKLGSTGSVASPGNGDQDIALTGSVALSAGTVYYSVIAVSSTAIDIPQLAPLITGFGDWNLHGIMNSAGLPLPSSLTVAWDSGVSQPIIWFAA